MAQAECSTNVIHETAGYRQAQKATVIPQCSLSHSSSSKIRKSAISIFAAHTLFSAERLEKRYNCCHCLVPHTLPVSYAVISACFISIPATASREKHYLNIVTAITALIYLKEAHKHKCVASYCIGLICNFKCY